MERARETAEIIASSHEELQIIVDGRLNEVFSPYDGWKRNDVEVMNYNVFHPNYEEPEDILNRVQEFILQIRKEYPGQEIIAVTHEAVILFMYLFAHEAEIATLDEGQLQAEFGFQDAHFVEGSISTFTYYTNDPGEVPGYTYLNPRAKAESRE